MCHIDSEMRHQEPNRHKKKKALMVIPRKWQCSLTSLLQSQLYPTTCSSRLCQPTLVSHGKLCSTHSPYHCSCLSFLLAVTSRRTRIISNLSNCCSPVARTVLSTQGSIYKLSLKNKRMDELWYSKGGMVSCLQRWLQQFLTLLCNMTLLLFPSRDGVYSFLPWI